MSAHYTCPACGFVTKDNHTPHAQMFDLLRDDSGWEYSGCSESASVARVFCCPCGEAVCFESEIPTGCKRVWYRREPGTLL